MRRVTIFTTNAAAARFDDLVLDESIFAFEPLDIDGPVKLIDGHAWVFVDWVLENMSGLEMCRRLRASTRFAEAHVTIVLDSEEPEDMRRSLQAGADDYARGPLDRQAMLDRVLALYAADHKRGAIHSA